MPSIHEGHRMRTKKEFPAQPSSFSDHRVLELLLFYANPRGDTNPLAHELVNRFGSISGVLDALPEDLKKVPGIGDHALVLLKAVKETSGRYLVSRTNSNVIVKNSRTADALLRPYFFGARVEKTVLLCMDAKGKELGIRVLSEGSVNQAQIAPRSVVEAALSLNASQVMLAHNHVSGLAFPSEEDKMTTRYLANVLKTVEIHLADHLIFTDDDMISLRECGFFDLFGR